jgi:hypothetical protein
VLHTRDRLPDDWCHQLISDLQSLEQDPLSPLFHGEIIKADYATFRQAVAKAIQFNQAGHPLSALPELMFAAYGSQIPDEKTGMVEPSMLSFANNQGGKVLLRDIRELIRKWDAAATLAALNGTAAPIPAKSFRWAPHEYRPAAYRPHDPGSQVKGDETLDHPAFNIFAFFGISCVPAVSRTGGCDTAGFFRDDPGWAFNWPVWDHPLAVAEVIALLCSGIPGRPGVFRMWKARRHVTKDKNVYFAPATLR